MFVDAHIARAIDRWATHVQRNISSSPHHHIVTHATADEDKRHANHHCDHQHINTTITAVSRSVPKKHQPFLAHTRQSQRQVSQSVHLPTSHTPDQQTHTQREMDDIPCRSGRGRISSWSSTYTPWLAFWKLKMLSYDQLFGGKNLLLNGSGEVKCSTCVE